MRNHISQLNLYLQAFGERANRIREINRTEAGLLRSFGRSEDKEPGRQKKELFGSSSLIKRLKKSGQSKYISTAKFKSENMVGEAYYFSDDGKLIGILGLLRDKEKERLIGPPNWDGRTETLINK